MPDNIPGLDAHTLTLRDAVVMALAHVEELEDTWRRGIISEHDGTGGTRSNRNVDVRVALQTALKLLTPGVDPQ